MYNRLFFYPRPFGYCSNGINETNDNKITNNKIADNITEIKPLKVDKILCDFNHKEPPLLTVSNSSILKTSTLGGITLPENTDKGTTFNLASISVDTSNYTDFNVHLNFCCNLVTEKADIYLRFQIFKQIAYQLKPVPIGVGLTYVRKNENTELNSFSLIAVDYDSIKSKTSNYNVIVEVMGGATKGTTIISNPILIATIVINS